MELEAIKAGEKRIAEIKSDEDIIDSFNFYDEKVNKEAKKAPAVRNTKRPGERNPTRDEAHAGLVNVTVRGAENVR